MPDLAQSVEYSYLDPTLQGPANDQFSSNDLPPPNLSVSAQDHYATIATSTQQRLSLTWASNPIYSPFMAALRPLPPDSPSSQAFSSPALSSAYYPPSPEWSSAYLSDGEVPLWSAGYTSQSAEARSNGEYPGEDSIRSYNTSPEYMRAHGKRAAVEGGIEEGQKKTKKKPPTRHRCYPCPICHKEFARPSSLATHMNMHTGAKREPVHSAQLILVPF